MILTNQISNSLRVVNIDAAKAKVVNMIPKNGSELKFRTSSLKFLYRELQIMNGQRG